jgi:TolB-like protein/Tfp pilus assembly protein PilF
MSNPSTPQLPEASHGRTDLLDSWKAIAAYLNRDVRTAQRWERTLHLPVHRVANSKLVFAYRSELQAWLSQQESSRMTAAAGTDTINAVAGVPQEQRDHRTHLRRWIWLSIPSISLTIVTLLIWRTMMPPAIDSLAILPFINTGGDPNTEYLSEGFTENLINSFSQFPSLRVAPRSLVFSDKGRQTDPSKAGRDLKVGAVLMGRVTQRGDSLNVQAELIDVGKVAQIWGRQYNGRFSDIIQVQDEITKGVAEKLHLQSIPDQRRLAKRSTENTDAYQAYLKGRYYWNRRTEQTLKRAVEYFQKAIDLDPSYALAYAGLADCYIVYSEYEVEAPRDSGPKAQAAAAKALQIDDKLAEAHASLAFNKMQYEWDWASAKRGLERAIELDPNYATAHEWYSIYLESTGHTEEAVVSARRAQQLDPLSLIITAQLGQALVFAWRHDDVILEVRKALEMEPNFARGHFFLGMAYEQKRMYREAVAEFQKAFDLSGGSTYALGALGHAYAMAGNRDEALHALADLAEISTRRYVAPFHAALIYTALGEKDRAFEWLSKALDDHSSRLKLLKVDPRFASLHDDSRFGTLLQRMGLNP